MGNKLPEKYSLFTNYCPLMIFIKVCWQHIGEVVKREREWERERKRGGKGKREIRNREREWKREREGEREEGIG